MSDVGVVVVAHRSRDDVLALLGDLDASTPVVVVDTGSDDGTVAAVRAAGASRSVRVLELANTGYARAANAGIRALPAAACVLVLNADVRLRADVPGRLAGVLAADPSLGAVGPRVRYPSGAPQASARNLPGLGTAVLHALLGWWWPGNPATRAYRGTPAAGTATADGAGAVPVDWVSGCAVALNRRAADAIGGFDPGYPLFVEDVDLCDRLAAAGWGIAVAPSIEVVHAVGGATAARPVAARFAHARGLVRFVRQRLPAGLRPLVMLLRPAAFAWALVSGTVGRLSPARSTTGEPRTSAAVRAGAHERMSA